MGMQNRVTPTGEIVASDLRCDLMGNRGCLHRGREIVRPWRATAWITCRTEFRGWRAEQWAPGRYTVLFFHDEAVALAAGHRPCGMCRRDDLAAFTDAWEAAHGTRPRAPEIDAALHAARLDGAGQRTHRAPWAGLPEGTFVASAHGPALVTEAALVTWRHRLGYRRLRRRPTDGMATVLTPAPTVAVLAAGYRPQISDRVDDLLEDGEEQLVEWLQEELAETLDWDLVSDLGTVEELLALRDPEVARLAAEGYLDPSEAAEQLGRGWHPEDLEEWTAAIGHLADVDEWSDAGHDLDAASWFLAVGETDPRRAAQRAAAGERPPEGWYPGADIRDFVPDDDEEPDEWGDVEPDSYPPDRAFP